MENRSPQLQLVHQRIYINGNAHLASQTMGNLMLKQDSVSKKEKISAQKETLILETNADLKQEH